MTKLESKVQTARRRLGLGIHDELQPQHIRRLDRLAPITIIERREALPGSVSAASLEKFLVESAEWELKRLYESGVCRVVTSDQISLGIDFRQLGVEAIEELNGIRAG